MKSLSLFLLLLVVKVSHAQIAINSSNTPPHSSAMLDVGSTSKGALVPRMTLTQRLQIASPAKGLLVFDNSTNSFWYFDGVKWGELSAINSNQWKPNGTSTYFDNSGNVGIGTTTPQEKLEVAGSFGLGGPLKLKGNTGTITFDNVLGNKMAFWSLGANHYGVGLQSGLLQMYTDGASSDIAFGHGSSTAFNENVRIKGNGNVGIGVNNPASKLTVNGGTGNALEIQGGIKVSGGQPAIFQLVATDLNLSDKNIYGYYESVTIDNIYCNNDPTAIILITPLVNRSGVWVQYDTAINRWKIRFELPVFPSGFQNIDYAGCSGPCQRITNIILGTHNFGFSKNDKFNIMVVKR
jgi:hypothetical protein